MNRYIFALIIMAISTPAYSNSEALIECIPTVEIGDNGFYPEGKVGKTNDLRWKTGAALTAIGDKIMVSGIVKDEKCLPVAGAKVEIWHADVEGRYKSDEENKSLDKYFAGSGRIFTDNTGRFRFTTIMPGVTDEDAAPYISLRVKKGEEELFTRMYFPKNPNNENDADFSTLSEEEQEQVLASKFKVGRDVEYSINITIPGIASEYKRY